MKWNEMNELCIDNDNDVKMRRYQPGRMNQRTDYVKGAYRLGRKWLLEKKSQPGMKLRYEKSEKVISRTW